MKIVAYKKILLILIALLFLTCSSVRAETTPLFLDFEGTATNNRGETDAVITVYGNPAVDTSVRQHGSSSLSFDGSNDYIKLENNHDWDIAADKDEDWTVDFWAKLDSTTKDHVFFSQKPDSTSILMMKCDKDNGSGNLIEFFAYKSNSLEFDLYSYETLDTNWHHYAVVKVGNEYGIYLDGDQIAYTQDSDVIHFASDVYIGVQAYDMANYLDGNLDNFRINKSNHVFTAKPSSSITDTIPVP